MESKSPLLYCALPPPWDGASPGHPLVMSHRAGGNEAPENTLAALRSAEAAGSRVMQMDVLPTLDGTPVIFHDTNMKRATGQDVDIRQVPTGSLPQYKEVLDPLLPGVGAKPIHTTDFKDGRLIPTLAQLLDEAGPDTYLQLEFWDENEALIRESARQIAKAGRADRVILGSPSNSNIWKMCGAALPGAPRILPMSEVYKIYARYFAGILRWYKPPPGTVFNVALFTGWEAAFLDKIPPGWQRIKAKAMFRFMAWLIPRPKLFKYLEAHGVPVLVFILNREEDWQQALKLEGITAIQTDSPAALTAYLAAKH